MDTILLIELGFKQEGVFFGWHEGKLYQLPYMQGGRYYGLRIMKPKSGKDGWVYYRVRRKKMGIEKLRALLQKVSWQVNLPADITSV